MAEFDAKVRKVGDSLGILLPSKALAHLKLKPGQTIHVSIPEEVDWSRIWGKFHTSVPTQELIDRARTERD